MYTLLNTPARKAWALVSLALLVLFVPYLVPVQPSDSLSYLVGYNNRAAVVLFVAGAFLFAVLTGGELARRRTVKADALSWRAMLIGFLLVMLAVGGRLLRPQTGDEAAYALNRLMMLVGGFHPYTEFEFAYGPLHLYVPYGFSMLFHISPHAGYLIWWVMQWAAGTAMLGVTIRLLEPAFRYRWLLFAAVILYQMPSIREQGTVYTPVRMTGAAFFLTAIPWLWRRTGSLLLCTSAGLLGVYFMYGISTDQGTGVAVGLLAWLLVLALQPGVKRAWGALALFSCGWFAALGFLFHFDVFRSMKEFGGGGFNFPLVPSIPILLFLLAYTAGACALVHAWRSGQRTGTIVPMVVGGAVMLPAAMGRADLGHLSFAAPALLVGIAYLQTLPSIRVWWNLAMISYLIAEPLAYKVMLHVRPAKSAIAGPAPTIFRSDLPFHAPCPVMYRVINIWLDDSTTPAQRCLETGYYLDRSILLLPSSFPKKIEEMKAHPDEPLLLPDVPLSKQDPPLETSPEGLRFIERAFWAPKARHKPVSYQSWFDYIAQHYYPAATPVGNYRVWYPKPH